MTIKPLAVAMGDPAGVGPEIIAKAWGARDAHRLPPFFAVGDVRAVERVWSGPVTRISTPEEAVSVFPLALPVIAVADAGDIVPGAPDVDGARCAIESLELAVGLARSGAAGAAPRLTRRRMAFARAMISRTWTGLRTTSSMPAVNRASVRSSERVSFSAMIGAGERLRIAAV